MNNPVFQRDFFALENQEQLALLRVLKKYPSLTGWSCMLIMILPIINHGALRT